MTDHSELLKDARALAKKIASGEHYGIYCITDTAKLDALADLVEAQDTRLNECSKVIVDATKERAELLAACRTCDEVLTEFLNAEEPISVADIGAQRRRRWTNVRGLKRQAQRAVENADKAKGR